MTLVSLPARIGWKTERRGSAFWRTEMTWKLLALHAFSWVRRRHASGCCLATTDGALLCCNERRVSENSDSSFNEGTTDTITSEAKCAMRATATSQRCFIRNIAPGSQLRPISPGSNLSGGVGARGERTGLASSRDGTHCDCNNTMSESSGGIVLGEEG